MRELITDEMVGTTAQALYEHTMRRLGVTTAATWEQVARSTWLRFTWDARVALEAAAPAIAAAAWDEGYATSHLEWEHVYDGHTIDPDVDDQMCTECGKGNPYA